MDDAFRVRVIEPGADLRADGDELELGGDDMNLPGVDRRVCVRE